MNTIYIAIIISLGCFHCCESLTTGNVEEVMSQNFLVKQGPKVDVSSSRRGGPFREDTGCECIKSSYDCGCCVHLDIKKMHINDTGCVNITYLPDQYGISLTFSLDGKVYFNSTISARNPPPVCFGIPHLKKEASLCIDFYNLDISQKTFSGCIKLEARLYHILVEDYDLGCFHIPLSKSMMSSYAAMHQWLQDFKQLQEKKRLSMYKV